MWVVSFWWRSNIMAYVAAKLVFLFDSRYRPRFLILCILIWTVFPIESKFIWESFTVPSGPGGPHALQWAPPVPAVVRPDGARPAGLREIRMAPSNCMDFLCQNARYKLRGTEKNYGASTFSGTILTLQSSLSTTRCPLISYGYVFLGGLGSVFVASF